MPENLKVIRLHRVTESPYLMQDKIRKHVGNSLGKYLLGIFILLTIMNIVPLLISLMVPTTITDVMAHYNPTLNKQMLATMPSIPVCLYIFALLFNGVFKMGEALYVLTYVRSRSVEYRAMFEGISFYFKALLVYIVQMLIIALWSMLFIIPGIFAALNFSQSFYILADDPSKGVFNILAESKIRMNGNRMAYVKMLISYVPYLLLGALPGLIGDYFFDYSITTLEGICIDYILNATFYGALGYLAIGQCVFYELLLQGSFKEFKYKGEDAFREIEPEHSIDEYN